MSRRNKYRKNRYADAGRASERQNTATVSPDYTAPVVGPSFPEDPYRQDNRGEKKTKDVAEPAVENTSAAQDVHQDSVLKERHLSISLSLKRGRLSIYSGTLAELGNPGYIRLLLSRRDKRIAVQVCEEIDRDAYHVSYESIDKRRFEISSLKFQGLVYRMMKWDPDKNYKMVGYPVKNYRLVLFLLEEADVISEEEFDGE